MTDQQFLQTHPKGHFLQSDEWTHVKKDWRARKITITNEAGEIIGYNLVLVRRVPHLPWAIMYSPRGFVCDVHDKAVLEKITDEIKKIAKEERAYIFKADPDVLATDEEFKSILRELGYNIISDANFGGVQPSFVFRLNIAGKTEDEVFAGFHQKWRYNIRLAGKKGVTIRVSEMSNESFEHDLTEFHRIMVETGKRDGFATRGRAYFALLLRSLGENVRLYVAEYDGQIIAGTIAIAYGNKTWYLYGASSNASRDVMPNYLLQWEMIRWAIERGCEIYDFRGVSGDLSPENHLYGLYRFKKGFGGELCEFVGEAQIVFKPLVARIVALAQRVLGR